MHHPSKPNFSPAQERFIIILLAIVQFINIVDFMMVMPLGPDFAEGLGIGLSHLGIVAASYTAAAAISGIACSFFIDRFDRKKALVFAMIGLVVGTFGGAMSWNLTSLLVSRVVAGAFGGPAASASQAIVADIIPPERRGKALSTMMMGFSLASIFGVPAGLELAKLGTWHTPFYAVSAIGLLVACFIYWKLPSMTFHLHTGHKIRRPWYLLTKPKVLNSYLMMALMMISGFMLFPNIAAYVQKNLGFPREDMSLLYLSGGAASLLTMRYVGMTVDKLGSLPVFLFGTIWFIVATVAGFYFLPALVPPFVLFILLMFSGTLRNVSSQTLASKVPTPEERAGFMSIQSAVQHISAAVGGLISTSLLAKSTDQILIGMPNVAVVSVCFSVTAFISMYFLRMKVKEGLKP